MAATLEASLPPHAQEVVVRALEKKANTRKLARAYGEAAGLCHSQIDQLALMIEEHMVEPDDDASKQLPEPPAVPPIEYEDLQGLDKTRIKPVAGFNVAGSRKNFAKGEVLESAMITVTYKDGEPF